MKMKAVIIFLLCLTGSVYSFGQKHKAKFHSINSIGLAVGQSGDNLLFQSVNGVAPGLFFLGAGIGVNYYRFRSYPIFFDGRAFFNERKKGFAYADIGYNISARNKPGKEIYYTTYKFSGGIYTDIGVGYRTKFIKASSFIINAGFTYKEINNKVGIVNPCLTAPCPVDYSKYHYGFGTVVLKAGVGF